MTALLSQICSEYEGTSKIFRTDAVKNHKNQNKRVRKLPTSTQLRATWHTDSLDMVFLPSTDALRYHNCCIDGGTSPEYFGYTLAMYLLNKTSTGGITTEFNITILRKGHSWVDP
jgi:hypothetical protein